MKLKYKIILFLFLLFTPLFLTGCRTETMKSPEKLLEKPISDEDNYKIYNEIRKLTPIDTTFLLPKNANKVGRINVEDLNKDGSNEIIAFKKKVNEEQGISSIYMYVFEAKGSNIIDDSERMVRISGDSIKSVNFVDVKNNGKKQIVLHVSNRGFENIYIYEFTHNNIKKIAEYSTSTYAIKLNFFDYNRNGKEECLALLQDLTTYDVVLSKMLIDGNEIKFEKYDSIKNVDGIEKIDLINGKVSKNEYGTILIYQSFPGSVISQIIVYKDGKFKNVLDENNIRLKNTVFMKPMDIDNNGILDIPKIEFRFTNNTHRDSNLVSWYEWNSSEPKNSSLELKKQIFYCYDFNFMYTIPKELENKFYIEQNYGARKSVFTFYKKGFEEDRTKLFDIIVVPTNTEEVENKTKVIKIENIVLENDDFKYLYSPYNKSLLKKYNINTNTIKKYFKQINE